MFLSRMLAVTLLNLAAAFVAQAADTHAFSVQVNDSTGKPVMFQSTAALKKGDVINIQSFNTAPIMILQIAMCSSDCPNMHLVKTVSLTPYYAGTTHMSQRVVVPEDGHVSFWVQRINGAAIVPIHAPAGPWYVEFVDRFMSFATPQLFLNTGPLPVSAMRINDNTLQARFYHRTFVNVSLTDASG